MVFSSCVSISWASLYQSPDTILSGFCSHLISKNEHNPTTTRGSLMNSLLEVRAWRRNILCIPLIFKFNANWVNPFCVTFFIWNIKVYLHFISFFPTGMTEVVEILPQVRRVSEWWNLMAFLRTADSEVHIAHISHVIIAYTRSYLFYIISIMGGDVLVMQGARVSPIMILSRLNWNYLVPTC